MFIKIISSFFKFDKISSLLLRFSGIGAKFILLFLITKYKSLEFQGSFTLINQSITLMIYFVGLDFYTFYTKKMVKNIDKCVFYFKNAIYLYLYTGLIVSIVFVLISMFVLGIDLNLMLIILVLFAFEHLGQELIRIYIALEKITFANVLLFLRTGLWALMAVVVLILKKTIEIEQIFIFWIFCSFLSIILGFVFFPGIRNIFNEKIDKKFIKEGIIFSTFIFLSTICIRLIEYSDKYILAIFESEREVGIYSVYFQISNVSTIIISTIILAFVYPKILLHSQERNMEKLTAIKREVYIGATLISCCIIIGYLFFNNYLYEFLGKEELKESRWAVLILVVGSYFLNISHYYNIILMGFGKVKMIFYVAIGVLLINIILNVILIPLFSVYGAAVAQFFSGIIFFILRKYYTNQSLLNLNKAS
ncbi:lipopolysaccharide biosynthesis protein [Algibacter sp. L1A34]|uniref:lipopolysaccharide biosynthesis protein n=1 Tax=Algibacter sp. L1A34 TaxID=2686365 RepID=UPI00131EBCBB|nr:polysaccharide biosynthesis C-terminal domain-containing protein [Algibacter sp. L1A34]